MKDFTIQQLAEAVGKTENFIRQHIFRGHLKFKKEGHRTYVTYTEARRWCRERGLTISQPQLSLADFVAKPKVARLTVAARLCDDGQYLNLFTLLRIRRRDRLGPWQPSVNEVWKSEEFDNAIFLFTFDGDLSSCESMINLARDSGKIELGDRICRFDVHESPRSFRAYRDHHGDYDEPIQSPFKDHSASIREYWCRESETRRQLLEELSENIPSQKEFGSLGFPLRERIDRVGNIMVATAMDQVTCELIATHNRELIFDIDGDFTPGEYRATLWAMQNGDTISHSQMAVRSRTSNVNLPEDPDRIGFEIHSSSDDQCIDRFDVNLIEQFNLKLAINAGPPLELTDKSGNKARVASIISATSNISMRSDVEVRSVERMVRTRKLGYMAKKREISARREGKLRRFEPLHLNDARSHFVQLLRQDDDKTTPIYLADRYFVEAFKAGKNFQFSTEILEATRGREFRVLCTQSPSNKKSRWWKEWPTWLIDHLVVRCFRTQVPDLKPAFHDRYLITPQNEVLLTHSLNGWSNDGVTFVTLPYGVYRERAEHFWSMALESTNTEFYVEEYV